MKDKILNILCVILVFAIAATLVWGIFCKKEDTKKNLQRWDRTDRS